MKLLTWFLAIGWILTGSSLRADDVKLKSGKVYKELTLISESATSYVFLDESGKKLTLSKSAIESIEKKPTIRGTFIEKEKALDRKEPKALTELGLWAKENGLLPEAEKLFSEAIKRDTNYLPARQALGDQLENGKWISGKDIRKRAEEALLKAYSKRGYKLVGKQWLSPVDQARQKKGLVEHDGHWVTPDIKKKAESEGWVWMEGAFVSPEHKKRMDAGERLIGKNWRPVLELNDEHITMEAPWILAGEAVGIHTNCKHAEAVQYLEAAEDAYALMKAFFGGLDAPGLYDTKGRIIVYVGRKIEDYQTFGKSRTGSDRESLKSSSGGVFYSSRDQGGVFTYRESDASWPRFWIAQGIAHAYVARFRDYKETPEAPMEALGGYSSAARKGKFAPTWWHYSYWLNSASKPLPPAAGALKAPAASETAFVHGGFYLHYLQSVDEEAFRNWWIGFLFGEHAGDLSDLRTAVLKGEQPNDNSQFEEFVKRYKETFVPWDQGR